MAKASDTDRVQIHVNSIEATDVKPRSTCPGLTVAARLQCTIHIPIEACEFFDGFGNAAGAALMIRSAARGKGRT